MLNIKEEDFLEAIKEATKVFGVDPAYYGEEGRDEVIHQLEKLGYNKELLEKKLGHY